MTMHELFDGSDPDLIERRERVIAAAKEVFDYEFQPYTAGYLRIERFYTIAHKAGLERAAEICAEVGQKPSSLWGESGCWTHSAQVCAETVCEEVKK